MKAPHKKQSEERGIALFMAIFALMLLSAIAAGFMFLANTETVINSNYRQSQQAYFAARAGLQEARVRIMRPTGDLYVAGLPTTAMPDATNTNGGIYIVNGVSAAEAATIQPWVAGNAFFDDTFCKANYPNANLGVAYGTQGVRCTMAPAGQWARVVASTSANTNTPSALLFKWTRISLKSNRTGSPLTAGGTYPYAVDPAAAATDARPVCWDGTKQILLPAGWTDCATPAGNSDPLRPVYVLASMGTTPGGSERTLSMEVADDPPTIVHGAVVSNDIIDTVGSSAVFLGSDNCKCSCDSKTGACTNRVGGGACSSGYSAITTSQTISSAGNPVIAGPTTTPATPPSQTGVPFPYDIPSLINRYKSGGSTVNATGPPYNLTCTGSLTATPPTANCGTVNTGTFGTEPTNFPPNPTPVGNVNQTTYVPGSLDLQAHNTGSGILVVDGDLVVHGGLEFYGLIIVKGAVTFTGGGSGGGSNIIGAVLAGQSAQADTLGGSVNLQFDRCALDQAANAAPPRIVSSREIEY